MNVAMLGHLYVSPNKLISICFEAEFVCQVFEIQLKLN